MDKFPNIYSIAKERDIMVEKACEGGERRGSWNVRVNRHLKDWEVGEYCNLLGCLTNILLKETGDSRLWKLDK